MYLMNIQHSGKTKLSISISEPNSKWLQQFINMSSVIDQILTIVRTNHEIRSVIFNTELKSQFKNVSGDAS